MASGGAPGDHRQAASSVVMEVVAARWAKGGRGRRWETLMSRRLYIYLPNLVGVTDSTLDLLMD